MALFTITKIYFKFEKEGYALMLTRVMAPDRYYVWQLSQTQYIAHMNIYLTVK